MDWKEILKDEDPDLYIYLQEVLNKVRKYEHIYKKAPNPARAQLWIAIAILYKELKSKKRNNENIDEKVIQTLSEKF